MPPMIRPREFGSSLFRQGSLRWLLALAAVLALSATIWFVNPGRVERRIYFFPKHYTEGTGAEERLLRVQPTREGAVDLYVREYLLGPALNKHFRLLPIQTRVKSLFIADGVLYVDLDHRSLLPDYESRLSLTEGIELLKKGIRYNFSDLRDIVVTIEGRESEEVTTDRGE